MFLQASQHGTAAPSIAKLPIVKKKAGSKDAPRLKHSRKQTPGDSPTKRPFTSPKRSKEESLPRTRELKRLAELGDGGYVIGVDEAGRGPLAGPLSQALPVLPSAYAAMAAGPVVAAACIIPPDCAIAGA